MLNKSVFTLLVFCICVLNCKGEDKENNQELTNSILVSTPVTTESCGKNGIIATQSVMRVINKKNSTTGTAFLHKSGVVITAAHIVENCQSDDCFLLLSSSQKVDLKEIIKKNTLDLAILRPKINIKLPSLKISNKNKISVGSQVTTWRFPSGYNGYTPLLTVGYLSGVDHIPTKNGHQSTRWVVNAAFNSENSGGPVLDIETGEVIGVVSSKLAPIPLYIESALKALSNQGSGFMYTRILDNGQKENVSEGQIIGEVLYYLRSQTQLVLGHAVTSTDLVLFLQKNNIKP